MSVFNTSQFGTFAPVVVILRYLSGSLLITFSCTFEAKVSNCLSFVLAALSSDCFVLKYFSPSGCRLMSLHIIAEEQGAKEHIVLLCPEVRQRIWTQRFPWRTKRRFETALELKYLVLLWCDSLLNVVFLICCSSFLKNFWVGKLLVNCSSRRRAGWFLDFLSKCTLLDVLSYSGDGEERRRYSAVCCGVRASSHTLSSCEIYI